MFCPGMTGVSNYSCCSSGSAPAALDMLKSLDVPTIVLYAVLTLMTVIANLVLFDEVLYLMRKMSCQKKRSAIIWVSGAAPVIASTSCVGMWVPLSSLVTELTAAVYFAIVIHKFQTMIIEDAGGNEAFLKLYENTPVKISTGPCCCCCLCLPFLKLSRRLLFMLKLGTFQLAFLRPILMIFTLVLQANNSLGDENTTIGPGFVINIFLGVSTIIALWPIGIVFNKVKDGFRDQKIIPKFALYQFALIFSQLQTAIINILALFEVIACVSLLSSKARGTYMAQQLLIIEMFVITLLSRIYYKRTYDLPEIVDTQASGKTEDVQSYVIGSLAESPHQKV
ncbi:organic solute transporter subunit alpha [Callorhinchus milii]|uniref:Organic solute transporter subunit alpha-like protein n=1 Tax=Callorhinchus milii TaxID=7868 RepID=V9KZG1_CALMI|nr:organic solute transporter subunit alpha [Callorhinchus milii]|eukprot:gi/632969719/ref/XP_007901236.1/ PREDICTED: organic solute transporter subunit alpha-like [Callorhinchus milii]